MSGWDGKNMRSGISGFSGFSGFAGIDDNGNVLSRQISYEEYMSRLTPEQIRAQEEHGKAFSGMSGFSGSPGPDDVVSYNTYFNSLTLEQQKAEMANGMAMTGMNGFCDSPSSVNDVAGYSCNLTVPGCSGTSGYSNGIYTGRLYPGYYSTQPFPATIDEYIITDIIRKIVKEELAKYGITEKITENDDITQVR